MDHAEISRHPNNFYLVWTQYTGSGLQPVRLQRKHGYFEHTIYCRTNNLSLTTMLKSLVTTNTRLLRARFQHTPTKLWEGNVLSSFCCHYVPWWGGGDLTIQGQPVVTSGGY